MKSLSTTFYSRVFSEKYNSRFKEDYDSMLSEMEEGKFNFRMEDYIMIIEDLFDSEFCERVSNYMKDHPEKEYRNNFQDTKNFRLRNVTLFSPNYINNSTSEWREMYEYILDTIFERGVKEYINKIRSAYWSFGDDLEIVDSSALIYREGDDFKYHYDQYVEASSFNKIFAASLQLNDGYEGGEFDFPCIGKSFRLKPGSVIIFPTTWMFYHGIKPVTFGVRHAIITWSGMDFEKMNNHFPGKTTKNGWEYS